MHDRKIPIFWVVGGLMLFLLGATPWFLGTQTAKAQCGSQASSCKNCHEVQGEDPVNNDGTGWHQSHAFGDFCYICHGGNQQATDEATAHEGMVSPLSDINAACQQCHFSDLQERAQVYADELGVDLTSGGTDATSADQSSSDQSSSSATDTTASTSTDTTASAATSSLTTGVSFNTAISLDDPDMVDYVERYDEIVLGKRPVNWGNIALGIMIELLIVGGGAFVVVNETHRRSTQKKVEGEYPADVVDMLPAIASLKLQTRRALKKLLGNPHLDKVLGLIDSVASDDQSEGESQ